MTALPSPEGSAAGKAAVILSALFVPLGLWLGFPNDVLVCPPMVLLCPLGLALLGKLCRSGAKALLPGTAVISRNYDRAATYGSGGYKLGANYAQSLHAYNLAHNLGYRELLFLDTATHTHIEEFGSSNFFAIKDNTYITPDSHSVLPSITNKSLRTVAEEFGLKVERRKVFVEELAGFEEVNSCGTAVVITPICSIDDKETLEGDKILHTYKIGNPEQCGPVSEKLYRRIIGIQKGMEEDTYGWCLFVDRK